MWQSHDTGRHCPAEVCVFGVFGNAEIGDGRSVREAMLDIRKTRGGNILTEDEEKSLLAAIELIEELQLPGGKQMK